MTARTWGMFATRRWTNGSWQYIHFGDHEVRMRIFYGGGRDEIAPVLLTECPTGPFFGWVQLDGPVVMIQPRASAFEMQFPYGSAAEVAKGRGEVVRLAVSEA